MPEPATLGGKEFDWKGAGSAILAIGMRPCSGALIVLTFALLNGLILGGIASVFAMAIGTAGFTAAMAVVRMEQNGQTAEHGPVIVTGATTEKVAARTCVNKIITAFA